MDLKRSVANSDAMRSIMSKSKYGLMVVTAMVVLVTVSSGVMAQNADPPAGDDQEGREDVTRDFFDDNGNFVHPDQKLADVANKYPGGFGGYYFDEADKSHVYVYMTDTSKTDNATSAFRDIYQGQHTVTTITTVQGQYAFNDLMVWLPIASEALEENDISVSTISVKEIHNRIEFGLRDWSQLAEATSAISETTVPVGAVRFVERNLQLYADRDNVRAKWRPVVGGVQHKKSTLHGGCTIGFVTKRSNVKGMALASHCTNPDGDIGGPDDAEIHQPNKIPLSNTNKIADETIDPYLSIMYGNGCEGYYCRFSDAAFARMLSSASIDLGKIAKPEAVNDRDVDPVGTTFSVTREGTAQVGDSIYLIGRTKGWLTGKITDICTTASVPSGDNAEEVRILCVGEFEMDSNSNSPALGDSGAPVMEPLSGNNVSLVGTFFSGNSSDGIYYYSQIGLIYSELGSGKRWDSCVSGC